MPKLGAHLSISGGYDKALINIHKIGGNCLQIFSASPRIWQRKTPSEGEITLFHKTKKTLRISPVYFHATYLINLADNSRIGNSSKFNLIDELNLAAKLGALGSIIHLGSFKNQITDTCPQGYAKRCRRDRQSRLSGIHDAVIPIKSGTSSGQITNKEAFDVLINNIDYVLEKTPESTLFIIENAGNRKIGQTLEEISAIVKTINNSRLKVCLDTCHLHAAGYELGSREKLGKFIARFDKLIGLDRLELFHINDSKDKFGSLRDRHENIGRGKIGLDTFKLILNHPRLKHLPFIIETPGFDGKGPDRKNLEILKSLIYTSRN